MDALVSTPPKAFSSDTGSREENASKQKPRGSDCAQQQSRFKRHPNRRSVFRAARTRLPRAATGILGHIRAALQ
jgi:hypothetical protein